eukprot:jgi/Mesvir1/20370/Mv26227-RA.1
MQVFPYSLLLTIETLNAAMPCRTQCGYRFLQAAAITNKHSHANSHVDHSLIFIEWQSFVNTCTNSVMPTMTSCRQSFVHDSTVPLCATVGRGRPALSIRGCGGELPCMRGFRGGLACVRGCGGWLACVCGCGGWLAYMGVWGGWHA